MTYTNDDHLVETDALEEALGDPGLRILDCSVEITPNESGGLDFNPGRAAWEEGHIPGASFVDFTTELSDGDTSLAFMLPKPPQFAEIMSRSGVTDGTRVVVYDSFQNMWAARLWWMLRAYGFRNTAVLNGGLTKWKAESRRLSTELARHPISAFVPQLDSRVFAAKEDVLRAIGDSGTCIVDALNTEHYTGDQPVGVERPGHIKSAVNVPWLNVVDMETHTYLPEEELRKRLNQSIANDQRVITYCGAGIAASSVAFALKLIGRNDVSIYDGSLFEWTADPSLPMEVAGA